MIQAALGARGAALPTRYVFDEGHHLFDAADGAFSVHLTGQEASDLRRWLLGAEGRPAAAAPRAEGAAGGSDREAGDGLAEARRRRAAPPALPGDGWRSRLAAGTPLGAAETFLSLVRRQVEARADDPATAGSGRPAPITGPAGRRRWRWPERCAHLPTPLRELLKRLASGWTTRPPRSSPTRGSASRGWCRGIRRRGIEPLGLARDAAIPREPPPEFVDWLGIERIGRPRARCRPATATGSTRASRSPRCAAAGARRAGHLGDADRRHRRRRADWAAARPHRRAPHLAAGRAASPRRSTTPTQTRVFIVTDVRRDDLGAGRRRLSRAVPGRGRRRARPVHRDRTPARRAQAHRAAARAGRAAAARRSMSTRCRPRP